jgi:hypothetical protein
MREELIGFFFGFVFTAAGFGFLLIGAHRTQVTCTRVEPQAVNCTIQSSWLGRFPQTPRTASNVQQAVVTENCDSDGCTYRVELLTPAGSEPLTNSYSSGFSDKEQAVRRVNGYLAGGTAEPLQFTSDLGMGWFVLIPIVFVLIGLAAMAGSAARLVLKMIELGKAA